MLTVQQLETFLRQVDKDFPVPISQKKELSAYARQLCSKATLCACCEDEQIQALVAGYTENLPEDKAYIALVATIAGARGKGLASGLVKQFLEICRNKKNIAAVHLYTDVTNTGAIGMYRKLGFRPLVLENEMRPEDVHLIFYLNEET